MNELTISLDVHSSTPLYEQIYDYIKNDIQNGGLPFKERLPSTRNLAKHLQVSRSTIDLAYEQLLSEGFIQSVPYKGYFVNDLDGLYHFISSVKAPESEQPERMEHYQYDFSPSGVDLNSFPHHAWRKISNAILMEDNKEFFQLGEAKGEPELRRTIGVYLHQARGVNCSQDQIIVGAGNDYLLMLLCCILGKEHVIAMENPTYKKAYDVLKICSNEMRVINMDKDGMDAEELARSDADIAYVMPSHQYPLGTVMPIRRRMELLKWASAYDGRYIIEDDYDSEFRYKGKPIPALQGYDRHDKVIYIGTFSKSIAPAIRVSYMVLPRRLLRGYEEIGRKFSSTVSRVDQIVISRFLNLGYYERHLNKMRAVYKSRHDVLIEQLKSLSSVCTVSGENAGVHILLSFLIPMSEQEALTKAKEVGVVVYGLSNYYVEPAEEEIRPTVILGYANLREEDIVEAVRRLAVAWME